MEPCDWHILYQYMKILPFEGTAIAFLDLGCGLDFSFSFLDFLGGGDGSSSHSVKDHISTKINGLLTF